MISPYYQQLENIKYGKVNVMKNTCTYIGNISFMFLDKCLYIRLTKINGTRHDEAI